MQRVGRNDPCSCGKGKKYKYCCGLQGVQAERTATANTSIPKAMQAAVEHHQAGRLPQAEAIYRQILQAAPNHPDVLHLLGLIAHRAGKNEIAVELIGKAISVNPSSPTYHNNLGNALKEQGKLDEAIEICHKALLIKPEYVEAHNNLGNAFCNQGRLRDGLACYRKALEINPDYAEAHSNLIFTLDLADTMNLSELHVERKKWDEAHAASFWQDQIHSNDRSPARRLRVGYVSADFGHHSAPKVFGGMLTQFDRSQFDVFAYSNLKRKADSLTDLFKQNVTVWRNIAGLPDDAVAKMIREDQIDILVDLSGHTAGNRLLVFARKPPIQITAWGYATGTGMRAMDVFFADPVMAPPEDKPYFTEEVRYLPCVVGAFFNMPPNKAPHAL